MRVQEKVSASCAKMTEERSMNGDVPSGSKRGFGLGNADGAQSPNLTATADSDRSCSIAGGRLKFFKDGKFILELSHRKDGDRTSWVPVPKKTYWPPPAAAGTPRQESSTSLSVSDDNSSVQSSPWQRDHCWKQSNPRHNISKEMTFIMQPLRHMLYIRNLHLFSNTIRRKRRCPYDPTEVTALDMNNTNNRKLVRVKKIGSNPNKLTVIVQTLWERVQGLTSSETVASSSSGVSTSMPMQNHARTVNVAASRMDPSIISPRKRILREMERVSLEDLANSKRQRARTTSALPHNNNNNGSSSNCTVTCQTLQPGSALPSPPQSGTKSSVSSCSYSITSLLGTCREDESSTAGAGIQDGEPSFLRNLLKSPSQQTTSPEPSPRPKGNKTGGSRKTSPTQHRQIRSPSHHGSPTLSPSPESLRSGLRTPVVPSVGNSSHSSHLSTFLPPPLLYAPPLTSPYLPHHPTQALGHHPYYSGLPPVPPPYRSSPSPIPSYWVNYPLSSLPRGALYPGLVPPCHPPPLSPCPWGPMTPQPLDDFKKDDGASDVPLNLSKHAG
ncbi:protein hairless [Periplaneta americana]|uniref:protein hairless n=1 Tax=Periplaneta americana TaxID=6978 RepID=UPI0037E88799